MSPSPLTVSLGAALMLINRCMAPRHPSLSAFSWSADRDHRVLMIAGTDALSPGSLLLAVLLLLLLGLTTAFISLARANKSE